MIAPYDIILIRKEKGVKEMAKVIVEMDFDFDGFDTLDDEDKSNAIEVVLLSGAESTCSDIKVTSIIVKDHS